jgi:anti-sigma B factor antagonist
VGERATAGTPLSIITTRPAPGIVRVYLAGEIDLATAGQLRTALSAVIAAAEPGTEVWVDLALVTFLDAMGIGVLVRSCHAARDAGLDIAVHKPRGIVQRVIELLGVVELLGITQA